MNGLLKEYILLLTEKIHTKKGLKTNFGDRFKLSDFKSFDNPQVQLYYANTFLKELGHGSSRAVYLLSSNKALKIAMNEKGFGQNEAEVAMYTNPETKQVVAKIYESDNDYKWLISELVKPIEDVAVFETLAGISWDDFCDAVRKSYNHKNEEHAVDIVKAAVANIRTNNMMMGDVLKLNSWGQTTDGRPVLLDYGYTKEVSAKYYPKDPTPEQPTGKNVSKTADDKKQKHSDVETATVPQKRSSRIAA